MKIRILIFAGIVVVVLIALGVTTLPSILAGGSFSTQTLTIQGESMQIRAAPAQLEQTFKDTVPPDDGGKAWKFNNTKGCACYELDPKTSLPIGSGPINCAHGSQAKAGLYFSAYCTVPNSKFYLER